MKPIRLDPRRLLGFRLDAREVFSVAMPADGSAPVRFTKSGAKRGGKNGFAAGVKNGGMAGNKAR